MAQNIIDIGTLIGRAVLSVQTANKLGQVHDLVIDPLQGGLAGLSIKRPDESCALVEYAEIHGIGDDAVMIERDDSLLPAEQSPVKDLPLAKNEMIGVKVITERGQLIGTIADLYVHLLDKPVFVFEVRSSIFDKLLGHSFYFPASLVRALSEDRRSLVISDETDKMDHRLDAVAKRLSAAYDFIPSGPGIPQVTVRSHS
jgi:uncharacterized protein YrrD